MNVRVGDITEQLRGVSYAKSDAVLDSRPGYLPVLRANNITNDGLAFDDLVYVPASRVSEKQHLQQGDIVVAASSGSLDVVGKAAQLNDQFRGAFGAFCKVLRPNKSAVDPSYLSHFFRTQAYRTKISSLAAGVNINNLKNEHLDDLEIPLPPLDEQRRIAAILDKADSLRRKRKRALELIDGLTQSIFLEMFGDPISNSKDWPTFKAIEVCTRITVGIVVRPASYYQPKGVPALRSLNVREDDFDLSDLVYIGQLDNDSILSKSKIYANDVVIVRTGQPGKAAVVTSELNGANAIDLLIASTKADMLNSQYFCDLLNSSAGKAMVVENKRGQIQQHLNVGSLKEAVLPIPPIDTQREYVRKSKQLRRMKATAASAIAASNFLFSSLQHRAFSGQL